MKNYKGTFNWYGEVITLTTKGDTLNEGVAYRKFTRVLALRLQRTPSCIKAYFNGTKDNYEIKEVTNGRKES